MSNNLLLKLLQQKAQRNMSGGCYASYGGVFSDATKERMAKRKQYVKDAIKELLDTGTIFDKEQKKAKTKEYRTKFNSFNVPAKRIYKPLTATQKAAIKLKASNNPFNPRINNIMIAKKDSLLCSATKGKLKLKKFEGQEQEDRIARLEKIILYNANYNPEEFLIKAVESALVKEEISPDVANLLIQNIENGGIENKKELYQAAVEITDITDNIPSLKKKRSKTNINV